jgi:hypothetical protein
MANLLEDIVSFYIAESLVTGYGVDAFADTMPESPDACVAVYEYLGLPPSPDADISTRSIQICVRNKSANQARKNAVDLYNSINPTEQRQDLTITRWALVAPKQVPFKLKVDTQGRTYYAFNLEVTTYADYN